MPVAQPTLSKQQSKLPSSMRYERVQDILENEPAFRNRISSKSHPIDTRFGEKMLFSKETVEITEALHAEGKDAHKVPKTDVLIMAAKVLKIISTNGQNHVNNPPAVAQPEPKPKAEPAPLKKKQQVKSKPTPAAPAPKPVQAKAKAEPVVNKNKSRKPEQKIQQAEVKPARLSRPEVPKPVPPGLQEPMPESELPPEKQPLRLPPDFDPSKFPHYSVQSSIYGLLLSALSLAEHYERFPNREERMKDLEAVMKKYLATCDTLKLKTT